MMWITPLLLVFASCQVSDCKRTKANRIIDGRMADVEEFPYQASIQLNDEPMCGGSIIHRYVILTAAHCTTALLEADEDSIQVRVGSSVALSGGAIHKIGEIVPHEAYEDESEIDHHDIALLLLKTPIRFNENVQPVKLTTQPPKVGVLGTVSGFGTTNDRHAGRDLMAVDLPVVPLSKCKSILKKKGAVVTDDMICAGYLKNHKDACTGDSGGPFVKDGIQYGVVAWGIGCGRVGLPGVYTNVAFYWSWIEENVGKLMEQKGNESTR